MRKWQIQLEGHKFDLSDLYENQESPDWSIIKAGDTFYLAATSFNGITEVKEVQEKAAEILNLINGLAQLRLPSYQRVILGGVSQIDEGGNRHLYLSVKNDVSIRSKFGAARLVVINSDGKVREESPEKTDALKSYFSIATEDSNVAEALHFYGSKEHNWINLYKIYEIIADDMGGKNTLEDSGFTSTIQLGRFTSTAQRPELIGDEARHARIKGDSPSNPMTLDEARGFIKELLIQWLNSKS